MKNMQETGYDRLKTVLGMFGPFSEQELEEVAACFRPGTAQKNTILLQEDSVCRAFYFITSGCIRIFFNDRNGREKTRYVMMPNHIGTALTSFISQKPSIECIEALEDTAYLAISHADFYRLNNSMTAWKLFYQKILEMAYGFQNRKIEQLVTLSARQRYEQVLKEHPALIRSLSNRVLASYLDIREETLSRLKSG